MKPLIVALWDRTRHAPVSHEVPGSTSHPARPSRPSAQDEPVTRRTFPIHAVLGAALVVLVLLVLVASAAAAGTAKDPLSLVLKRSDFPAKTTWRAAKYPSVDKMLAAAGFKAKSADYAAEIVRGQTETLYVSGRVVVLASAVDASRLFAQFKSDIALTTKVARPVRLPVYGDEQSAFTQASPGTRADLRVRKGAVVWRVEIKWGGVEKLTVAQALKELQIYATKLQRRVGSG